MPYKPSSQGPSPSDAVALLAQLKDYLSQSSGLRLKLAEVEGLATSQPAEYDRLRGEQESARARLIQELTPLLDQARAARESLLLTAQELDQARTSAEAELQALSRLAGAQAPPRAAHSDAPLDAPPRAEDVPAPYDPVPPPAPAAPHSEEEELFGPAAISSTQSSGEPPDGHDEVTHDFGLPPPKPRELELPAEATFSPVLIVKDKDDREQVHDLQAGQNLVGRAPENDIILLEENVSRRHCRLVVEGGTCTLEDLGSSNGTFINAERLVPRSPRRLDDNDVVKIGKTLALYRASGQS